MIDQAKTLEPFLQRREQNLAYFKTEYKDIYNLFKDYKMKDLQVDIQVESDEVNLIENGAHVYPGGAKSYAAKEVDTFRLAYREQKKVCSFVPPFYEDYQFPRFGQLALKALLKKSPVIKTNFNYYELGEFYPLIVFFGCGLGYQIEIMARDHNVHNLIVVEPDLDKFAASLYSIDWYKLCKNYKSSNGKSMHFILGAEKSEYLLWAVTWNRLIELGPHFPVMTLFYNHQGSELFDKVSDKVNKDLFVFLLSWGHYDDEIRQLNNALHNFHQGVKELPRAMETPSETPVFIVGSGPSLDDRIDYLKEVMDEVIIISCGTSLRTLAAYGVKPDIHIELESDLLAYIAVSQAADEDFYKDIKLIGPSHISPLIYQLFGDGRMYYKAESATSNLFGADVGHIIKNGTPTCTNLGLALAVSMGFKNLFLFGLDFGFKDINNHHSKGSIYYEKLLKLEHKQKDLVEIETVDGGTAWSTPPYFTSKRKAENLIQSQLRDEQLKVYNCSDVAKIEGAEWLKGDTFLDVTRACKNEKQKDMDYLFNENAVSCDLSKIDGKLKYLEANLISLSHDIEKLLSTDISNLEEMSVLCSKINWYLEDILKVRTPDFYYFVRGSMRHFLCAGFAHSFSSPTPVACIEFIQEWKKAFVEFFKVLPEHFKSVVYKDFDIDSDPWMKQAITDTEEGINPYFTQPLDGLQLEY